MQLEQRMYKSPIVLALDSAKVDHCESLIDATSEFVGVYKLGLEFFTANGPTGVLAIRRAFPEIKIFLDLKMHDIPNTVGKSSSNLAEIGIEFLTVHASGGPEMIKAAVEALPGTRITAVTLLTSIDQKALEILTLPNDVAGLVSSWASTAVAAGSRAIVASPHEVATLRKTLSAGITLITPGIRTAPTNDDQKRVMTPTEAITAGADLLVIGRPITGAANPGDAARTIFESLH
ncbi:MAG: orotidine-5'-phosphate decarboxylase [Candidatus Nanopelagicaceae bacterium]|jgi:orotidine-5'-phosphate decarboxylase